MGNTINIDKYVGIGFRGIIPSAIDPSAAAYFTATGITGATQQTAIDNLVKGLKADGLWSKMKAVYPFVTDQRNLASFSEDFANAAWIKSNGAAVTANTTTAPDGTSTADTIVFGSDVSSRVQQVLSNPSSTYVYSFYLRTISGTTTLQIGNFDALTTITVTNSWQRFNVNITTSNAVLTIRNNAAGNTSNLYIWGAQVEMGSTLSAYQPQLGSAQAAISSQFKYNLVNPVDSDAAFRLVFNGGWTHSSNGATPNGTNGYADTKLVPSSVLTLNSTHLSFYSRTSGIVNGQRDIGVFVNGSDPCMSLGTNTGVQLSDSYNFITNRISASIANALGFINGSRVSSTSHKLFKNGSQIGTTDTFANVTSLPNQRVYLGAVNTTPDPTLVSGYSTKQTAFASIGNGLLDAEAAALYSHVQNFQLALNRAV